MLKNISSLILLCLCLFSWGQRVDISEVKFSNSTYFHKGYPYNGTIYDTGPYNLRLSYEIQVKNGKIEGDSISYLYDSFFKRKTLYQDSILIRKYESEFIEINNKLNILIKDSTKLTTNLNSLKLKIGNKLSTYEKKHKEGKLKNEKLILYEDYLKTLTESNKKNSECNLPRRRVNESLELINSERKKPKYINLKQHVFKYEDGKCYHHSSYNKDQKLLIEEEIKDNLQNGYYKKYFNDLVIEQGNYNNGMMVGEWVFKYNDGQVKCKGKYIKGDGSKTHGEYGIPIDGRNEVWHTYYKNGNLKNVSNYNNGQLDGDVINYDDKGNLISKLDYENGKKEGTHKVYYSNGQLFKLNNYMNNQLHGKIIWYHQNGVKQKEGNYLNGKKNGKFIDYYDNGNIKSFCGFRDGSEKFEGNRKCKFNKDGSIAKSEYGLSENVKYSNENYKGIYQPGFYVYKTDDEIIELRKKQEKDKIVREKKNNTNYPCSYCGRQFLYKYGVKRFDYYSGCRLEIGYDKEYCSKKCAEQECETRYK